MAATTAGSMAIKRGDCRRIKEVSCLGRIDIVNLYYTMHVLPKNRYTVYAVPDTAKSSSNIYAN